MSISVVIPTLDEEALVASAIASVRGAGQVVVVDGGSRDRTVEIARAAGAAVVACSPGRGRQLDRGARHARGDWLVFLHADTRLDPGWDGALGAVSPQVVGGAFRFALDSPRWPYRAIEAAVALRCRVLALPYGDQALFVRRPVYARMGGFRDLPLMEDVDFVRRLRREGPIALLEPRALTSPRRWEERGLLATSLRNLWILGLYTAGRSPDRLARLYVGRQA